MGTPSIIQCRIFQLAMFDLIRDKKSDLCIQVLCEYLSRTVEHFHKETAIICLPSAVLYLRTWNSAMKFALDHSLVIAGVNMAGHFFSPARNLHWSPFSSMSFPSLHWLRGFSVPFEFPKYESLNHWLILVNNNHWYKLLNHYWLVVWNMNFIFPYIGNVIIPTDQLIFSEEYVYHQPVRDWLSIRDDYI